MLFPTQSLRILHNVSTENKLMPPFSSSCISCGSHRPLVLNSVCLINDMPKPPNQADVPCSVVGHTCQKTSWAAQRYSAFCSYCLLLSSRTNHQLWTFFCIVRVGPTNHNFLISLSKLNISPTPVGIPSQHTSQVREFPPGSTWCIWVFVQHPWQQLWVATLKQPRDSVASQSYSGSLDKADCMTVAGWFLGPAFPAWHRRSSGAWVSPGISVSVAALLSLHCC